MANEAAEFDFGVGAGGSKFLEVVEEFNHSLIVNHHCNAVGVLGGGVCLPIS